MKLQLGELRPIMDALPAVLDKEIPAKTAYWLARAFKQIGPEFEPFEKARQKLVEKHAKRDKKGKLIVKDNIHPMKDMEAFNKEYTELAGQEIEIKYEPITVEQLGDAKIKGNDILMLGRLIKEE